MIDSDNPEKKSAIPPSDKHVRVIFTAIPLAIVATLASLLNDKPTPPEVLASGGICLLVILLWGYRQISSQDKSIGGV